MKNYTDRIKKIKDKFKIPVEEDFTVAIDGTNFEVFTSVNFVIRFNDKDPEQLVREADFLNKLDNFLIPKVLWSGEIDGEFFMVENRLPGQTINKVWKNLSEEDKRSLVHQVINFLKYQKTFTDNSFYSVKSGNKYESFLSQLTDGLEEKILDIQKFNQTQKIIINLISIIQDQETRELFKDKTPPTLVHGDLIIHNLLTDGKNLTGVIDWELAMWSNPDYDLFRLFYYQECAKAYLDQKIDETFESDYMNLLISEILKSDLIKDEDKFRKKYKFVHAIFILNALYWAVNSSNPKDNFAEILEN